MAHDFALHSYAKTMAKYVNTHGLTLTIQRYKQDKKPRQASKETTKKTFSCKRELARGTLTTKHTQSLIFTLLNQWHTLHSHAKDTKERKRKLKQS